MPVAAVAAVFVAVAEPAVAELSAAAAVFAVVVAAAVAEVFAGQLVAVALVAVVGIAALAVAVFVAAAGVEDGTAVPLIAAEVAGVEVPIMYTWHIQNKQQNKNETNEEKHT